jgi:hypothetical protein
VQTAAAALEQHGFTGEALLKLSRKAAHDALRRRGSFLDQDRFDDLADYLLEVGVQYAVSYQPGHGIYVQLGPKQREHAASGALVLHR